MSKDWRLSEEKQEISFGPLWKYLKEEEITDVDWDSGQLWIKRVNQQREAVVDNEITEKYMQDFAVRVGNHEGRNFNPVENILYAETDTMRITCVHPSLSLSGLSVSIRKSLPKLRFTSQEALENGYCDKRTMAMLVNCVRAGYNFVFCGEPGKGKTEAAKFFSSFIPDYLKVVTVEDIREWHYANINPGKSCVEIKITDNREYERILSAVLRMNASWIMFAEVRSREVRYLLECWSNGISCMTTLHTGDVRDIPERILNMRGEIGNGEQIINEIYNNVGIGILMEEKERSQGETYHRISQVGFYEREEGINKCTLVVEEGKLHIERIPEKIRKQVEEKNHRDIFDDSLLESRLLESDLLKSGLLESGLLEIKL